MKLNPTPKSATLVLAYALCIVCMLLAWIPSALSTDFYQKAEIETPTKTECIMILDAISTVNEKSLAVDVLSHTEETHEGPARQKVLLPQKDISYSPNIWGVSMTDEEIYTLLYACSQYDDVTVSMALSVIQQESQFTRDIISSDGHDYGFFQIRDSNHEWLREVTGCDPKTPLGNIVCGVYMLHYCHLLYGPSSRSALTAYRWGSDNGNYAYADLILFNMEHFESLSEN